ncbi:hypothetical protein H6G17_07695 [Chroococcidiopsis sp. FACHB-1243]|uniref:hypothetical protein n=1 Tax=Chroococcidiopsis sp. [FACHB-1243] TaxID=2692781 RepID=UPI00178611B5|nr:hypothetical protein [Chroococcidiopsis sp. [FACHB-1243]]MBD2305395.1 hypothetical protein [Chroococcidiopsis sp. [FACHB-1243]]
MRSGAEEQLPITNYQLPTTNYQFPTPRSLITEKSVTGDEFKGEIVSYLNL